MRRLVMVLYLSNGNIAEFVSQTHLFRGHSAAVHKVVFHSLVNSATKLVVTQKFVVN